MARSIDPTAALRVLEGAARAARAPNDGHSLQGLWEDRTRQAFTWTGNKTAVAALGTALLAKATDPDVDALSLKPESGRNGYAARTLARVVLAAQRNAYGYVLGTSASDPLANSPWFGGDARIDLITKWRAGFRPHAFELVGWLADLRREQALDALVGFLRVCMERRAELSASIAATSVAGAVPSIDALAQSLQAMISADADEGRLGTAVCAAAYGAVGHRVDARAVNAPGQTDIDVRVDGAVVLGIEVKQKPATAQDALDIADGAAAVGASKALLAALSPEQEPLDLERVARQAERDSGVVLDIAYRASDIVRGALFSSTCARAAFLDRYPGELSRWLAVLEASEPSRLRWKATVERWVDELRP